MSDIVWSYGVMTISSRAESHLPRTLFSLETTGFKHPHLFIDAEQPCDARRYMDRFGCLVTCRIPAVGVAGNWVLSLYELYIRKPNAEYYVVFQDDILCCRNLRRYLEECRRPKGYLNLYTSRSNEKIVPRASGVPVEGWYESNQLGRGALALVFDRETVVTLLCSRHLAQRPQCPVRGKRSIDGGIITALHEFGVKEYVHHPSLIQHTGDESTIGNPSRRFSEHVRGEESDPLALLRKGG